VIGQSIHVQLANGLHNTPALRWLALKAKVGFFFLLEVGGNTSLANVSEVSRQPLHDEQTAATLLACC
jgi:hypothetical protein